MAFENRYLHKDGSFPVAAVERGAVLCRGVIYSSARDVTDRKRVDAERERLVRQLRASLAEIKSLRDTLPICMYCKRIRDDKDYWHSVDGYIAQHTTTRFSHGICPDCMPLVSIRLPHAPTAIEPVACCAALSDCAGPTTGS